MCGGREEGALALRGTKTNTETHCMIYLKRGKKVVEIQKPSREQCTLV